MSTQEEQHSKLPRWWVLLRDVGSTLAGWVLVFMEVERTELRESVLVFAAGVVGIPAGAVGLQAARDALAARRSGTSDSPSSSPELAPGGSPSSPS